MSGAQIVGAPFGGVPIVALRAWGLAQAWSLQSFLEGRIADTIADTIDMFA
jgi:hypothetical protein